MIGLSEDEMSDLAAARATLHATQAIIDRLEQKSRNARLEEIWKSRQLQRVTKPKILCEKFRERPDFP